MGEWGVKLGQGVGALKRRADAPLQTMAKSSSMTSFLFGVSSVLITLFSDDLQMFMEVVDKLFGSSSAFWLKLPFLFKAISPFIGPFTYLHSGI